MRLAHLAFTVAVTFLAASPFSAHADTVYTYTGNPYTAAQAPYTTSDFISGSFTVKGSLGANLSVQDIPVLSYSFSDGVEPISSGNGPNFADFVVATDANGDISQWMIQLVSQNFIISRNYQERVEDMAGISGTGVASNSNDPGTWTSEELPAFVPEPSTFVLLGTGLLGIAGAARRKFLA
jgi:hypothetical protein